MQRFQGRLSKDIDPAVVQTEWNYFARRHSFPPTDLLFRGDEVMIRVLNNPGDRQWKLDELQRHFSDVLTRCDEKCALLDLEEME